MSSPGGWSSVGGGGGGGNEESEEQGRGRRGGAAKDALLRPASPLPPAGDPRALAGPGELDGHILWGPSAGLFQDPFSLPSLLPARLAAGVTATTVAQLPAAVFVVLPLILLLLLLLLRAWCASQLSSPVRLHHAPQTVSLIVDTDHPAAADENTPPRDAAAAAAETYTDADELRKSSAPRRRVMQLHRLVQERCPTLARGVFRPNVFLANGHFQTAYASWTNRYILMRGEQWVPYQRELLSLPDGGVLSLDWSPSPPTPADGLSTPVHILVIFHGLTGGSHETYIMDVVREWTLAAPAGRNVAVVVNSRGCARTEVRTPRLYTGGGTADVRFALRSIASRYPKSPLFAVGYSLGANFLTKFVGEEREKCVLSAFAAVANPFDLQACSLFLHTTWIGRTIYSFHMARSLQKLYMTHREILDQHPTASLDASQILSAATLPELDTWLTCRLGGFRTHGEYYRSDSSAPVVPDIRIPGLFLSALDDPVVTRHAIARPEVEANPHLVLATTDRGGHLGWFEGSLRSPRRWCSRPVVEFFQMIGS
ncbi:hypothetical protein HK405_010632, partial [Cladochytrium tenue]